jgi:hypothetical protein
MPAYNSLISSVIAFPTQAEAEEAVGKLAGMDINGTPVTVEISTVSRSS